MKFFKATIWADIQISLGKESPQVCITKNNQQTLFLFRKATMQSEEDNIYEIETFIISQNIYLKGSDAEEQIRQACEKWGSTKVTRTSISESSFGEIADTQWYGSFDFDNAVKTLSLFELKRISKDNELFFESKVISPLTENEATARAKSTFYASSLLLEIGRIYENVQNKQEPCCVGLPVHYIVEGNNPAHYQPVLDTLIGALQENNRLATNHIYHFNMDKVSRWDNLGHIGPRNTSEFELLNEKFAEAIKGGTLIVEYGCFEGESNFEQLPYSALTKLIDLMMPYSNNTQLIFLIPPEKAELKQRLRNRLRLPLVEITKDEKPKAQSVSGAKALKYLSTLASRDNLAVDDTLSNMLAERKKNKSFENLDALYWDWRLEKLLGTSFPQYKNIAHEALHQCATPEESKSALDQLNELIGLDEIKMLIRNIILRFGMNEELKRAGLPAQPFSLHLAFMGEPGTGKTEVARLYGQILREAGVLTEGRVITVSGTGGWDIEDTFNSAKGSVLFIDEAYGMLSTPGNSIAKLIALMEERRNDTIVILAGYENEMNNLLDSNPGFRSRLGFTLRFPNYTNEQLLNIFLLMCARAHLILPEKTKSAVRDIFERAGKRGDQGNARFVRKLFEDSIGMQQIRLANKASQKGYTLKELQTLLPNDVGYKPLAKDEKSAREQLKELIGLKDVKQVISDRLDFAHIQKVKRDAGLTASNLPMHMAFKGNPGTGKTEVARLVGRILKEEGVLSVGDFYECGRQDLIGPFVGSTAPKIEALFQRARGSVIFIDEAYALNDNQQGGFGDEAITAIIAQMEKLRNEVVVIFAGYTQEIEELFKKNPGFSSRIGSHILFPDYSTKELQKILDFMAHAEGVNLTQDAQEKVKDILSSAVETENFGNARFARGLLEQALIAQGSRLATMGDIDTAPNSQELCTLLPEDFCEPRNVLREKPQVGFRV